MIQYVNKDVYPVDAREDSTDFCKLVLQTELGINEKDLKRGSKKTYGKVADSSMNHVVLRTFKHADGPILVALVMNRNFSETGEVENILIARGADDIMTLNDLFEQAQTIKHCGDYGRIHYNPETHVVWWCGGDGDDPRPAQRKLLVHQVRQVRGEAEYEPDNEEPPEDQHEDERGFIYLGQFGIVSDWDEEEDEE